MLSILGKNGSETPEPVVAEVKGSLPVWLQGTLIRNGPGLFSVGSSQYNHWFDGLSLIHSFTFCNGEVTYRSKFLKSDTYKRNIKADRIIVSEFGTMIYPDPCKNIFSRTFTHLCNVVPDFTDNNLVNIIRYGRDYYASSEVNYMNQIDPDTLETVGRINYRNHIALNLATAHPHYDDQGNTYNMGTSLMGPGPPRYIIFKVPADAPVSEKGRGKPALSRVQKIGSIPFRSTLSPSYFHSFGMTENFFIFVEQPFKLDIVRLATAYFRGVNWGSCLRFDKDDITLFHVINRKTGRAVKTRFYSAALVVFHHLNAYEEDDHLVFDLITYKDSSLYDMFYLQDLKTSSLSQSNESFHPPTCQRFVLPLSAHKESPRGINLVTLTDTTAQAVVQEDGSVFCQPDTVFIGLELPGINYSFNTKKYRYFYGSRVEWSPHPNKIAKVDIVTREHIEWTQDDCFPSEPVFVASPGAVEEDDGVILSSVISPDPNISPFMLILNAKNFEEIARASIPADVHMDLHGLFIPAAV
ncbi:beta,beta-carotene 15,15'-dioxygenase [Platichthys flesus]|uniref:beta,beta-carotene 15,15'-dioxygenase n=1 Tax=Platichthys flesus TaxID=8260 RepID=UPI002DBA3317|nr:beta,beta-carotene 15,15'-dioxygenase [Platichthys flesus]